MVQDENIDISFIISQKTRERDYWLNKLSGDLVKSTFGYDYKKTDSPGYSPEKLEFRLAKELFSRLMTLSKVSDVKLYMILVAGLVVLLGKYCGNRSIVVGSPILKQEIDVKFVNTVLALRNELNPGLTFKELLLQTRENIMAAAENQNYPIKVLLDQLNMPFSEDDFPLFDVAILLENIHDRKYIPQDIRPNMIFSFFRTDESIECELEYNSSLYSATRVERIINHFSYVMRGAVLDVDTKISDIDMLPPEERMQILVDFNKEDDRCDIPEGKTVHGWFEECAEKKPGSIACVYEDRQLAYKELNERAHRLARVLARKAVGPDTIVGLMVDPSLEMIVGILAILKAGGAYLPIDPNHPKNRVLFLLQDSQTSFLLTKGNVFKDFSFTSLQDLRLVNIPPILTGIREQAFDFDSYPMPDRSLVENEKYIQYIGQAMVKNSISIQATRGCPYKCLYCHKIWPKKHIVRSAENILKEVQLYYNMGVRRFVFVDDIFNLNIKNSRRFFELIIEKGLDVQFFFPNGVRSDVMTKEYIDLMVKAGVVSLGLVLETASMRLQSW